MAKKTSFTNHSAAELATFVEEKREALRRLRFSASGGKNADVKQGKKLRKEVARALTEVTARKTA